MYRNGHLKLFYCLKNVLWPVNKHKVVKLPTFPPGQSKIQYIHNKYLQMKEYKHSLESEACKNTPSGSQFNQALMLWCAFCLRALSCCRCSCAPFTVLLQRQTQRCTNAALLNLVCRTKSALRRSIHGNIRFGTQIMKPYMWMSFSTDLKPSRQCSCRLTHTESYTICQVQNLPWI